MRQLLRVSVAAVVASGFAIAASVQAADGVVLVGCDLFSRDGPRVDFVQSHGVSGTNGDFGAAPVRQRTEFSLRRLRRPGMCRGPVRGDRRWSEISGHGGVRPGSRAGALVLPRGLKSARSASTSQAWSERSSAKRTGDRFGPWITRAPEQTVVRMEPAGQARTMSHGRPRHRCRLEAGAPTCTCNWSSIGLVGRPDFGLSLTANPAFGRGGIRVRNPCRILRR